MPETKKDGRFAASMFPLVVTQAQTGFDMMSRDEVKKIINSHLKMLLLVNPGEIISDINFGVGLYQHLFLNENEPKIKNLQTNIKKQIKKYLPYLKDFTVSIDKRKLYENKLAVKISYSLTDNLNRDTLVFIVGEGTPTVIFDDSGGTVAAGTVSDILRERT